MESTPTLGGFKILKNVDRISVVIPGEMEGFPINFLEVIAGAKINLPYITYLRDDQGSCLNLVMESANAMAAVELTGKTFEKIFTHASNSAILSIFPHKKDPQIAGLLLEVFGEEGVETDVMASSPSAISVVLKEQLLNLASDVLFQPFRFGPYRTPSDWKLAQKGKEQLFKEVVASYQEKRPKVYGLEYHEGQELLQGQLNSANLTDYGRYFKELAGQGSNLTFLATSPPDKGGKEKIFFCLPATQKGSPTRPVTHLHQDIDICRLSSVAVFSMNGPHFGD
ncbi:MAG: hypothetical protein V1930_05230, partial [Pseudomonadota bacterium]